MYLHKEVALVYVVLIIKYSFKAIITNETDKNKKRMICLYCKGTTAK